MTESKQTTRHSRVSTNRVTTYDSIVRVPVSSLCARFGSKMLEEDGRGDYHACTMPAGDYERFMGVQGGMIHY